MVQDIVLYFFFKIVNINIPLFLTNLRRTKGFTGISLYFDVLYFKVYHLSKNSNLNYRVL